MIVVVFVAYNNPEQTERRWKRDVRPAVEEAYRRFGLDYRAVCVDNGTVASPQLREIFGSSYLWNGGNNLQYGPSINLAVRLTPSSAFVLYACSRHGRSLDPSWACDLLAPMVESPDVGMTGCLWGSNSPEGVAAAGGHDWVREKYQFRHPDGNGYVPQHVQGGVFAARTELLVRFPYPADYPHLYTDHLMTWAALRAGYRCVDVPSVRSVWRDVYPDWKMGGVKYLHDESPEFGI